VFSHVISRWVSSSSALLSVGALLLLWLLAGPSMGFKENWHVLVSTPSAAITFFMIFVLARAQAKDTKTIQIKLNEIIGALNGANNNLINIENLSESEIAILYKRYESIAQHIHQNTDEAVSVESIVAHEIEKEIEERLEIIDEAVKTAKSA
jgi:low affinity Fe/Cu permease